MKQLKLIIVKIMMVQLQHHLVKFVNKDFICQKHKIIVYKEKYLFKIVNNIFLMMIYVKNVMLVMY